MPNSNEVVIKIENCSPKHTQRIIDLLSNNPSCHVAIIPSEPIPVKPENSFKHFELEDKLRTLDSLAGAFAATKNSHVNSHIEAKISELLDSFQE
ncbi:hypothetical protein [Alkanindiges illinoisensis]|uniref:hypothetical protein n=1 Tax=Alkanindiges illinoisensis TaxID=197183 RepID=UPI00047C3CFF|nr:hypothetical protein [Alkanindiges illinoisensis]